jgi:DNA-binding MarR family transcriptional regulator
MHERSEDMDERPDRTQVAEVFDGLSTLLKVARRAKQRWSEGHSGLSAGLLALLIQIEQAGQGGQLGDGRDVSGCRLKDLAALAGLDASTVSRETAHLIALGLVERRSDPLDGRAARLALTEQGREQLRSLHDGVLDELNEALRSWAPQDVEAFAAALHRFARGLAEVSASPLPQLPTPAAPGASENTSLVEATR